MKVVDQGVLELRFVVREHEGLEYPFDWMLSTGQDSDELFESIEEAIADVTRRYT